MLSFAPKLQRPWFELILIAFLVCVALAVGYNGILDTRRYPNVRVEIEPYELPRGCKYLPLTDPDYLLKRCAAPNYRMRNATELGLFTSGKNTRWYRIGDDAVLLMCFRLGKYCEVRNRVSGKFVRSGYYRSLVRNKHLKARPAESLELAPDLQ